MVYFMHTGYLTSIYDVDYEKSYSMMSYHKNQVKKIQRPLHYNSAQRSEKHSK